jgi:hypothetical protein
MKRRVARLDINDLNSTMEANERGLLRTSAPIIADSVNGQFVVTHDLGVVPDGFQYYGLTSTFVIVAATEADRSSWTDTQLVLTGNAETQIYLLAFVRL